MFRKSYHFTVMKPFRTSKKTKLTPYHNITTSKICHDISSCITIKYLFDGCLIKYKYTSQPYVKVHKLGLYWRIFRTKQTGKLAENWCRGSSFMLALQHHCDKKRAEPKGKALVLQVSLRSFSHLWS